MLPLRASRRASFAVLIAVAVALAAGSIDLTVYLRAAADVLAGHDPNVTPPGELPWLYPPFAALLFVPLLVLPAPLASVTMALGSVAALARCAHLIADRLGRPIWVRWWPALLVCEPAYATLGFGQINLIVAWLAIEGMLGRCRWLLGVAAGIKLTPLVFLLPLALRRDGRGLAEVGAGAAITVALGWLLAPTASASFWAGSLRAAPDQIGLAYAANQSLTGAALRWSGSLVVVALLGLTATLLTVLVLRRHRDDVVLAIAATGLLGALLSPISWTHHWVWLLPLGAWCWTHGHRALAAAWGFLLVARVTWWWPASGTVETTHDLLGKLTQASWTLTGLATLLALALVPNAPRPGHVGGRGAVETASDQMTPSAIIASATRWKPAMFAPKT